jgi:hypothetical protein
MVVRLLNLAVCVFFVCGSSFLALMVASIQRESGDVTLLVDAASKSFDEMSEGRSCLVTFNFTNPGDRSVCLLGSCDVCSPKCCIKGEGLPVEIAPGMTRSVAILVEARVAGDFIGKITLYSDLPDHREILLEIKGKVRKRSNKEDLQRGALSTGRAETRDEYDLRRRLRTFLQRRPARVRPVGRNTAA